MKHLIIYTLNLLIIIASVAKLCISDNQRDTIFWTIIMMMNLFNFVYMGSVIVANLE